MKRSPAQNIFPRGAVRGGRRRGAWSRFALRAALAGVFSSGLFAQAVRTLPTPSALKKMSVEQLMDLEVTSVSKRPEKLSEVASAIQVITGDEVRRSGATSLPEALRLASNLEVAQIDSRQFAITARGFNNAFADKLLVLVDGRTVYTPLYAGVYWDVQDTLMEDLDRIEVISGPGATQWGANAVNGVINITTKKAKDTQGSLVTGGGGTELRDFVGARYGGQLAPHAFYRVYAKYFSRGDAVRSNGRDAEDSWRVGQTGFRADWESATGDAATLQGDFYDGKEGQAGPDPIRVEGGNLLGRWSRPQGEGEMKLQAYYDYTHRRNPGAFTQDLDTYDVDFQQRRPLGRAHDFVWGLGYRIVADDIANTPQNAFLPPRVTREWFSAFVQDEIALSRDRLHLTLGTKVEHNAYTHWEVQPGARLAWRPLKNHTWWAAVSRALRTPSRIDRDLYSPATPPYRIAGGPDVVAEKLIAYEFGYRVQLDPRLALSAAGFFHDYDDLRSLEPLNPPARFPAEASTGLRGHSAGLELSADWRANSNWRLRAGYTESRVHSEPQPGRADRSVNGSIARDPNHRFSLASFWDLPGGWECDATLRWVSQIGYQQVPAYAEADLRLGWHPRAGWEFSLDGQNLLHAHHAEFNAPAGRREIQRGVYAKSTWRF
ncbi:MAG TPA: TonB-dependent receptor [Opitutaceae bacterium]|nr:TonB-dependent receptor [Opitutaceae bacterium]